MHKYILAYHKGEPALYKIIEEKYEKLFDLEGRIEDHLELIAYRYVDIKLGYEPKKFILLVGDNYNPQTDFKAVMAFEKKFGEKS